MKLQRLREVAQKARAESENLENLLRQKQTELDLCMKEMEKLRMETDLQKKRVEEASHFILFGHIFLICSCLQSLFAL